MEDQSFLYVWKTYLDISDFFRYIAINGVDKLKPESYKAVQNTINANKNDILYLFGLMVEAKLVVSYLVEPFSGEINDEIDLILKKYNLSFEGYDLNEPKYHNLKIAWLLFLSQTKDLKGEELNDTFYSDPISSAGEILGQETGDLRELAELMHEKIRKSQDICICS